MRRSRSENASGEGKNNDSGSVSKTVLVESKAVDPTLALLFASSSGPVKAPPRSRYEDAPPRSRKPVPLDDGKDSEDSEAAEDIELDEDDEELSSVDGDLEDAEVSELSENDEASDGAPALDNFIEAATQKTERKRKRKPEEADLEGKYLQKLAREEEKEEEERQAERKLKRQRLMAERKATSEGDAEAANDSDEEMEDVGSDENAEEEDDEEDTDSDVEGAKAKPFDVPLHESLAPDKDSLELEKASRTVFLGNVASSTISSKADKKTLMAHLSSFLSDLPAPPSDKPPHKLESLRFRSTAYATGALPKKAAFAKKDLMTATTKSTNAYAVYSTAFAAREAVKKLNGSMVLDRHLRVDGVAHPAKTDHRRCVFVGNLGFVDDESLLEQDGENARKRSKIPSDIEEGLWRQFGKAGEVESVRVIRDEKTRVGKGFAYVQFKDANAVEAALLFNEKKYPPMLPRILRVVRAKAQHKQVSSRPTARQPKSTKSSNIYNPKVDPNQASLQGRASKLLGKAGAAKFKKTGANDTTLGKRGERKPASEKEGMSGIKAPESFVFEGYRASATKGKPKDLKLGGGGGGKKKGKPRTRSANRGSEWKKKGAKKGDDIEVDSTQETSLPPVTQAAETGTLAPRKPSGAFPVPGHPLLPPIHHTLDDLLKTLPSKIAYSPLVIKLDDGKEISIPRRELWDVRVQLMAEDEGNGEDLTGLGNDDVKTGVYEGGFKSWESSVDLVKVIAARANLGEKGRRRVIELGCGTALPSLAVLQWFLQRPASCDSGLDLGLADYNPTVLQLVTLPNVILSWAQATKSDSWEAEGELDIDEALISEFISSLKSHNIRLSFFSGAWSPEFVSLVCKEMEQPCEKMMIIGAETIYSPAALKAFAETLMALLEPSAGTVKTALIGAKKVYFGVGGSIEDFIEHISTRGALVERVREESDGVRRAVVEVKKAG
ncbi:nucleolar 12 protein [Rutstroemia sp. NJR-2017a BVV2]|nr:nucleolar 12 protein [Rutstroemia sp. NJR-2017a BVV2]